VHQFDSPFSTRPIHVAGVAFSIQDLGIIAVSLVLVFLLWLLFQFTKLGLALRASALNPEGSRFVGIRVGWMLAIGWGLAAAIGAVAGMMTASALGGLDFNMMLTVLLYALAAAVLGGLESPLGAVIGGLLLGVALNLVAMWHVVGSSLKLPVGLAIILLVLVFRPNGLFGRTVVRKV
jgi:branched-chain amino acid transport system permease protein